MVYLMHFYTKCFLNIKEFNSKLETSQVPQLVVKNQSQKVLGSEVGEVSWTSLTDGHPHPRLNYCCCHCHFLFYPFLCLFSFSPLLPSPSHVTGGVPLLPPFSFVPLALAFVPHLVFSIH